MVFTTDSITTTDDVPSVEVCVEVKGDLVDEAVTYRIPIAVATEGGTAGRVFVRNIYILTCAFVWRIFLHYSTHFNETVFSYSTFSHSTFPYSLFSHSTFPRSLLSHSAFSIPYFHILPLNIPIPLSQSTFPVPHSPVPHSHSPILLFYITHSSFSHSLFSLPHSCSSSPFPIPHSPIPILPFLIPPYPFSHSQSPIPIPPFLIPPYPVPGVDYETFNNMTAGERSRAVLTPLRPSHCFSISLLTRQDNGLDDRSFFVTVSLRDGTAMTVPIAELIKLPESDLEVIVQPGEWCE